ncbi:hypothetical protein [Nitrosomonas communis]|uniref:Trypsin-like peptidase domain-containing protein n=1 Tax=Nitrosomonas communis TaxID=44574 RepID=A0A1I4M853_9PROT|nr:hypothetical protein [Nitrosomonas communis]SFL99414.1 hypothetical protein SAMN05421863_10093 [Nitrosomonas communis]
MRKKISQKKLDYILEKARFSNVAKSCRRFLFNYLAESMEQRGYFHVDRMYGAGSGVLLKYKDKFFVLTAKHVLKNNLHGEFQNESPFWIPVKFKPKWETLYDFMFPHLIWNIGELMPIVDCDIVLSDICLVELFEPKKYHFPDHYIEIKNINSVLSKKEFYEGQFLLISGYPFEKNHFDFPLVSEKYTHSTIIHRQTIPGILIKPDDIGYISFQLTDGDFQHENLDGMSGGVVYNVMPKANQIRLAGIAITAGNNICRFIPSYLFIDAILDYQNASYKIIDPIINKPLSLERLWMIQEDYLREFDPKFKSTASKNSNN